jgi:hypothetical protein
LKRHQPDQSHEDGLEPGVGQEAVVAEAEQPDREHDAEEGHPGHRPNAAVDDLGREYGERAADEGGDAYGCREQRDGRCRAVHHPHAEQGNHAESGTDSQTCEQAPAGSTELRTRCRAERCTGQQAGKDQIRHRLDGGAERTARGWCRAEGGVCDVQGGTEPQQGKEHFLPGTGTSAACFSAGDGVLSHVLPPGRSIPKGQWS